MARELAVVLANGSIESAVTCALAAQKHRIVMLHAEMDAASGRDGQSFDALAQHFKPYRSHRLAMPFLSSVGGAPNVRESRESTNVDPRSTNDAAARLAELVPVIGVGLRFAMQYGAAALYLGTRVAGGDRDADATVVAGDVARWTEFGQLWSEMAQVSCERPTLEITLPLLELELWQVVDLGLQVGVPLQLTWSCDHANGDPCGGCRGCRERDHAFQRTGRPDPAKSPQRAGAQG